MAAPSAYKIDEEKYELSDALVEKLKKLAKKFPEKRSAVIPGLHLIQDEIGWLPDAAIRKFAEILELAPNKIYGVATFYTMFNLSPVGKYHIQVCRNVSCQLLGAKSIIQHLSEKLAIKPGETTKDGKFTLTLVECLGNCGCAPMMMINDKYYEKLTEQKVDEILRKLQ
jgi:NADH-quinone oxidoreductase subunit E